MTLDLWDFLQGPIYRAVRALVDPEARIDISAERPLAVWWPNLTETRTVLVPGGRAANVNAAIYWEPAGPRGPRRSRIVILIDGLSEPDGEQP